MARLPSERAPWNAVRHMYEIGRAPNDPQHPDHDLARELALGFWAMLPYIDWALIATLLARARRIDHPRSAKHLSTPSRRTASEPHSAASPAAMTAGRWFRSEGAKTRRGSLQGVAGRSSPPGRAALRPRGVARRARRADLRGNAAPVIDTVVGKCLGLLDGVVVGLLRLSRRAQDGARDWL